MLARGVKNIIVFVNSPRPFKLGRSENRYDKRLAPLFGFAGTPVVDNLSGTERSSENHVFGSDKFADLLEGLKRCQDEQKTLIFMDTYDVRENSRYGIRSYSGVKIVWIYNADVPLWRAQLPAHVRADLRNLEIDSDFERFPNYRTLRERRGKIIDLSRAQVNALAHLSCWNVTENAASIKTHFGL